MANSPTTAEMSKTTVATTMSAHGMIGHHMVGNEDGDNVNSEHSRTAKREPIF